MYSEVPPSWITNYLGQIVFKGYYIKPTGSRVTDHYKDNSDWDFVVYDPKKTLSHELAKSSFWEMGGSGNGSEFVSYKKTEDGNTLNLILVDAKEVFDKYMMATELIKRVDPKTKKERIELFDVVFGRTVEKVPF